MSNSQNNIELLVKIGIDTSNKTNLQAEVDKLGKSLAGLKVDINIDKSAIAALEKISTMDFSKLAGNAKKATDQVSSLAIKSAKEAKEAMDSAFGSIGKNFPKSAEKGFQTIEEIKKSLKGVGSNLKLDFDVVNGKKQLDRIVASFEKDGVTKTIHFKQATISDAGNDSPLWMPDKIKEVDKNLSIAAKSVDQLVAKMNKLQTEGKLTNTQFEHLTNSIKNIDKNGGMTGLNHQLDQYVVNNKKATAAIAEQERVQKEQLAEMKRQEQAQKALIENEIKRKNLILDIERAMKSQSRTLDQGAASKLIAEARQLDVTSKNFGTSLKRNQSALRELRTNATEATRQNIGLVEAFRTAFTKFPIDFQVGLKLFELLETP